MAQELVYTSAPRGLKAGSRGFCTVEATAGMPPALVAALEGLSGYRHVAQPGDPANPVVFSHVSLSLGGRSYSVVSRVGDAGNDYSGRTNKIAHHLVLDSAERPQGGPAWLLGQQKILRTEFAGEPRTLPPRRIPAGDRQAAVCKAWQVAAGDAGWAGVLAEAFLNDPQRLAYLVVPPGLDVRRLFEEAIALLPPDRRWGVTFTTLHTSLPQSVTCVWRAVLAGSKEAHESRRFVQALRIDLTSPLASPEQSPAVTAARTGQLIAPSKMQVTIPSSSKRPLAAAPVNADVETISPDTPLDRMPIAPRPERLIESLMAPPDLPRRRRFKNALLIIGALACLGVIAAPAVLLVQYFSSKENRSSEDIELAKNEVVYKYDNNDRALVESSRSPEGVTADGDVNQQEGLEEELVNGGAEKVRAKTGEALAGGEAIPGVKAEPPAAAPFGTATSNKVADRPENATNVEVAVDATSAELQQPREPRRAPLVNKSSESQRRVDYVPEQLELISTPKASFQLELWLPQQAEISGYEVKGKGTEKLTLQMPNAIGAGTVPFCSVSVKRLESGLAEGLRFKFDRPPNDDVLALIRYSVLSVKASLAHENVAHDLYVLSDSHRPLRRFQDGRLRWELPSQLFGHGPPPELTQFAVRFSDTHFSFEIEKNGLRSPGLEKHLQEVTGNAIVNRAILNAPLIISTSAGPTLVFKWELDPLKQAIVAEFSRLANALDVRLKKEADIDLRAITDGKSSAENLLLYAFAKEMPRSLLIAVHDTMMNQTNNRRELAKSMKGDEKESYEKETNTLEKSREDLSQELQELARLANDAEQLLSELKESEVQQGQVQYEVITSDGTLFSVNLIDIEAVQ